MKKNISKYVLDTYAIFAYLKKESGYKKVQNLLSRSRDKKVSLFMSVINYGELYYVLIREVGLEKAEEIILQIESLPLHIVDADKNLVRESAFIKVKGAISYADCFAIALAKKLGAALVTGDDEFKKFKKLVKISWI